MTSYFNFEQGKKVDFSVLSQDSNLQYCMSESEQLSNILKTLYSHNLSEKNDLVIFTVMHSSPLQNCCLQLNVSAWLSGASKEYLCPSPTAYLLAALVCVRAGQAWETRHHSVISSTPENPGI